MTRPAKAGRVTSASGFRERVEAASGIVPAEPSAEGVQQSLHELRAREIELGRQAQELRRAYEEMEIARDRYRELYALVIRRDRGLVERLVECSPGILLVLDCHGQILRANSRLADVVDLALEEVIGRNFCSVITAEGTSAPLLEAFDRAMSSHSSVLARSTPLPAEGGIAREIEWCFTAFEDELGAVAGVIARGQDVTERSRDEEATHQARRLEAVGTLTSSVAHDFNNVLMGIIGCADLALHRLPPHGRAHGYVEQMKATAMGGAAVINRLMAFARRQDTERKVIDLNSLVARMDTMLRHLLGEDIELCASLTAANAAISCQPGEIEQLVMNLSVNARHAMARGGRLTIATREAVVFEDDLLRRGIAAGRYVVLEVTDTGAGMDESTRKRIFEPFFTTRRGSNGSGLGLASVYATVEEHEGYIDVETAIGQGSRFTVHLPQSADSPARPSVAPDAPLGVQAGGETVLVIEDEPLIRLSVSHYLGRHGYRVLEAANEREVKRLLGDYAGPIDVLLTDMVLPGRGGPEIAAVVRAARPSVRVVFMSARPNEALVEEGRISDGTPTLQKPFTEGALISRVRLALAERALQPPRLARIGGVDAPFRLPRPRLLLVEDQAAARLAGSELLEELGYDVIAVANGGAAIGTCRDQRDAIDVIVTDVGLPDFSGADVARRVRSFLPGVGIVLLSGSSEDDTGVADLLQEPNTAFVQKPIEIARLTRAIDDLLEGTRRARAIRRR